MRKTCAFLMSLEAKENLFKTPDNNKIAIKINKVSSAVRYILEKSFENTSGLKIKKNDPKRLKYRFEI
jgi:hypothetical protein